MIEPAGEMWSVVTESPTFTSTRAPSMSATGRGSPAASWKNGGSRTYVDAASHAYIEPVGARIWRQWSSPSKMRPYSRSNCSGAIAAAVASRTSSGDGQTSRRNTGVPSGAVPSGSRVRSTPTFPARAYATHSGGEARYDARTCGWMRPSKLRLPDRTATTARSPASTAFATSSGSGPEFPMQVVHP